VTDYVPDPIRIFVYSDGIATAADPQISTFGPSALQTMARKLIALGYDHDQRLDNPSRREAHANAATRCGTRGKCIMTEVVVDAPISAADAPAPVGARSM
jgi:hypothetical protein